MFDQPHTAYLVTETVDKYNNKTIGNDVAFSCMIDRSTQFLYQTSQPQIIGRGVIYTSSVLDFVEGNQVKVAGETWIIKVVNLDGDNGIYHHAEIVYG